MSERRFDRIAEAYLDDGPTVLADRVLDAALDEVHLTRQRRVLFGPPWRSSNMNTYARFAVAAVAVIAIGYVGLMLLGPGRASVGAAPNAIPSATASPAPPTPTVTPTGTPVAPSSPGHSAPPLTGQFTSDRNGFAIAYPETWSVRAATAPWTSGFVDFMHPGGDVLYDASIPGDLFLTVASQPLTHLPSRWEADIWQIVAEDDPATADCSSTAQPVMVDGSTGARCGHITLVTSGGRGYFVMLYTSGDEAWIGDVYGDAWYASVLATMKLHPKDAVDEAASPSPS